MSDPSTTPAGWYDDGSGNLRYWDGNTWTEHAAPGAAATQSPADTTGEASAAQTQPYHAAAATGASVATADAPATAPATKPHVLGIIALAVAVVGFIFACIPGALIVGWILLPIAFVLSLVTLFLKGRKWPAIAGLIVSIVGTIVGAVVFFAVVSTTFGQAFEELDGVIVEASEAAEDIPEVDEPAEEAEPVPISNLAFGDTMIWEDGVELTVSAPEGYTPSEYAAGADFPNNIAFTMTIVNNSSENLDPLPYERLSSGGQEASQIFDLSGDGEDVGIPPTTVILPGQSVTWKTAWSVADPNSLTMQVSPSFEYEDAIFTNLP